MSSVSEIESAIRNLTSEDFWKLADWFDELRAKAWDQRMEEDAIAGRLDFLFDEAGHERETALLKEWPEQS
jgi:hypothetical protein